MWDGDNGQRAEGSLLCADLKCDGCCHLSQSVRYKWKRHPAEDDLLNTWWKRRQRDKLTRRKISWIRSGPDLMVIWTRPPRPLIPVLLHPPSVGAISGPWPCAPDRVVSVPLGLFWCDAFPPCRLKRLVDTWLFQMATEGNQNVDFSYFSKACLGLECEEKKKSNWSSEFGLEISERMTTGNFRI